MHAAQTHRGRLTLAPFEAFTVQHMTSARVLVVLIGIVLVERTYSGTGG